MTMWLPELESGKDPRYKALARAIERDLRLGKLKPGQRLPPQRDLADALGLSLSTVTRAYGEAMRQGLLVGTVGRGTFVPQDALSSSLLSTAGAGLVELGLVTPLYALEPDLAQALERLARRPGVGALLRYSEPRGLPAHRAVGAEWAARYGVRATAEDVVVVSGAQHGMNCCLTALFRPGERLAAECLCYPGLKAMAAMHGLKLSAVAMDEQGMLPEALDAACRRDEVKGVYLTPGMHNPTTVRLTPARRDALAEVVDRRGLTVIEDEAYALALEEPPRPISAVLPGRCVHIAGVSKVLGAGLRVAFMTVPPALRGLMSDTVLSSVWMTPSLNVELVSLWIAEGEAERILDARREEARRRNKVAMEALAGFEHFGWPTGFFRWLRLPEPWRGRDIEQLARERGLSLFGAERFTVAGAEAPAAVRLSLTGPPDAETLRLGLERLTSLLREVPPGPRAML